MAKNINSLKLLRSSSIYTDKATAIAALKNYTAFTQDMDGVAALARYSGEETGGTVKTVVGFYYQSTEGTKNVTIHDFDEDAWDSLTTSSVSGDSMVVIDVTQEKGLITTISANLTGVQLEGYAIASEKAEIASTDTLGVALGKLQKTINENEEVTSTALVDLDTRIDAMNFAGIEDGKVITNVKEENGVVSVSASPLSDIVLVDYAKDTSATGSIAATDTIELALSKLENNAASFAAYSISALTTDEISALPDAANIKEAYKLVDETTAHAQHGATIKIYKDSSLYSVSIGHVDDTITSPTDPTIISGTGKTAIDFIYILANGTYSLTALDIASIIDESEFKDGLKVENGNVKVKIDAASEEVYTAYNATGAPSATEPVLSVSDSGVCVSNIQTAINAAISAKTLSAATMNGSGVTLENNTLKFSIVPATNETTATNNEAITVQTNSNGVVTLGLSTINAGTFGDEP